MIINRKYFQKLYSQFSSVVYCASGISGKRLKISIDRKERVFMRLFVMIFLLGMSLVVSGCSGNAGTKPQSSGAIVATPQTPNPTARFIIAGSGTNLPLTAKLAAAYKKTSGKIVEVPKSIGSDGAIKAVTDGTIQLGLISRPLKDEEKALGLRTIPYAALGIAFAVHPQVPDNDISFGDILAIHRGEKTSWSDGKRILVLIRGMHDSSNLIWFSTIPGIEKIIQEALETKRWQVMYHDADMAGALRTKEGSFGHTDMTEIVINGGIKALSINGIAPTAENMQNGKYPWVKTLSFIYKGELSESARSFVDFVRSSAGVAVIRENGGAEAKKE